MKKYLTTLALTALFGCTTVNYDRAPPADWPVLEVKLRRVSMMQVQQMCWGVPFLWQVFMCMEPDFDKMECNIYHYYTDAELAHKSAAWIIEHELAHCNGYDHYGSTELRDAWEQWKIGKR